MAELLYVAVVVGLTAFAARAAWCEGRRRIDRHYDDLPPPGCGAAA